MDAYSRCPDHGITRCAKCNPRQLLTLQPTSAVSVSADWSPEDALDGPVAFATAPEPVSAPIEFDMQTQEAIERQKEILTARGGTVAPVVPAEVTSGFSVSPEPAMQNEVFAGPEVRSPVVEAACCIHKSQKDYDAAVERVRRAEQELIDSQAALGPAAECHAKAKQALRELLQ